MSQDTSAYGVDVKYRTGFYNGMPVKTRMTELCEALSQFGIWVRLHYVYPYPHVNEIIPLMAEGKILPYLDIPFQHASPKILKAMKRPGNQEKVLERIASWREICPELVIRSTFIVGFPGETEEQFEALCRVVGRAELAGDLVIRGGGDPYLVTESLWKFLRGLRDVCRRLIIDGPNCVIGTLPDETCLLVMDQKKLRPATVGGREGVWAIASEMCGVEAMIPDRDPSLDFQPMREHTIIIPPDRKELEIWSQFDQFPLSLAA